MQTYCSLTNHMWDGFWFLANKANWDALPKDIQAVITKNINAAALLERGDVAELTKTVQEQLTAKNMKFNTVDPLPFRDKLKAAGFYDEWKKKFGDAAWATLEGSVGSLG